MNDRYGVGDLDTKLRSNLSNIIYAWAALYPSPMTDFSREICINLSRSEVDNIISDIKVAMSDANNLSELNRLLVEAVKQNSENKFDSESFKSKLKTISASSKHLTEINEAKDVQSAINELITASKQRKGLVIDFDHLEVAQSALQKANIQLTDAIEKGIDKIQNEQFKKKNTNWISAIERLNTLKPKSPDLFRVIKDEVMYVTEMAKKNQYTAQMYSAKIDEILRDSKIYDAEIVASVLKSKFEKAREDIPKLMRVETEISQAVQFINQNKSVSSSSNQKEDSKLLTALYTKYPSHTPEQIQDMFQKQFQDIRQKWGEEIKQKWEAQTSQALESPKPQQKITEVKQSELKTEGSSTKSLFKTLTRKVGGFLGGSKSPKVGDSQVKDLLPPKEESPKEEPQAQRKRAHRRKELPVFEAPTWTKVESRSTSTEEKESPTSSPTIGGQRKK